VRRHLLLAAALGALLVVLVSACGGSGSKSSSPATTPATTTAATDTTPGFTSDANCRQLAEIGASLAKGLIPGSGATVDPKHYAAVINRMAAAAPSEIRADLRTFATAYSSFLEALKASGYVTGSSKVPTAAQLLALTRAAGQLSTPQVRAAERHLGAWGRKNCSGG